MPKTNWKDRNHCKNSANKLIHENRLNFYCFLKKKDTFANRFAKVVLTI